MKTMAITSTFLAATTHAYVYSKIIGVGHAPFDAPVLFEGAARIPNNTNEFPFSISSSDAQWTWRVNITNVAVPNATVPFPGESPPITPDPHVAYTTYDLRWPGGGTLNDELASLSNSSNIGESELNMCAYVMYGLVASSSQTDCSSLGDQCVQSIMSDLATTPNSETCTWSPSSAIQSCENILENSPNGGETLGFMLGNSTTRPNATVEALQKSEAFFYVATDAAAATNLTYFEQQQKALQILVLQAGGQSQMLCTSFNNDTASDSSGTSTSGSASSTSAAPSSTSSSTAVSGMERMVGFGVFELAGFAAGFSIL